MSSGLSRLVDQLVHPRKRVEQRIATLSDAGQTVDFERVAPNARVVEIDLGFGPESWIAPRGPVEITELAAVAGGALILAAGRRATTRLLRSHGMKSERIPTRL